MKKLLLSTSVAVGMSMIASASHAGYATEWTLQRTNNILTDSKALHRQTRDAINDVRTEVRDSTDRLIAALRLQTGEQSAYQDKAIEADKRVTDATEQNSAQRMRQDYRAKAESGEFDPDPSICILAGLYGDSGGGGGPAAGDAAGSKSASNARTAASGADPAVKKGGTALAKSLVEDQKKHRNLMGYPDPTTDPAVLMEHPTLPTETPEDQAAVDRLIRNLTDPLPPRPVTAEQLRTPAGQSKAAKRIIQQTRAGAGQELLAMIMNMRDKVSPSDEFKKYAEDIADYKSPIGDQISELQGLDIRTLRYYGAKQEVVNERSTMSEKALLQSLLDSVSIGNRIAYLQLQLDSRRGVVETQILSTLANGT